MSPSEEEEDESEREEWEEVDSSLDEVDRRRLRCERKKEGPGARVDVMDSRCIAVILSLGWRRDEEGRKATVRRSKFS